MKKLFGISLICFILCVNYISCTNDSTLSDSSSGTSSSAPAGTSNGVPGGGAGNESGGTPTPAPTTEPANTRVFDFTNAKALAKLERVQTNTSASTRAANGSNELGEFVKILEDGTMQNVVTVTHGSLSEVKAIYKSPEANSKYIYILFQSNSNFYDSNNKSVQLGRFICVHEDGSIADILKNTAENSTYSYLNIIDDSVTFDSIGKVYFIAGSSIYQFDSKTNTVTQLVVEVQGTNYSKIQVDKAGQWLFAYGSRHSPSSSSFLRAIPIENPNSPINVFYSSTRSIYNNCWVYDDNTESIYYSAQDGNNAGLFKATKAGGFANKTFVRSKTLTGMEDFVPEELFESFRGYTNYSWNTSYTTNGLFDANKVVAAILAVYNLSADNVDIRFDKYASESGALKVLALLTQGKKNAAAISALNNTLGMAALYSLSSNPYFAGEVSVSSNQSISSSYLHNFLRDILYVKNTDTLLNFPLVTMNGRYLSNNVMSFVMCNSYNNKYYCYEFKKTIPNVLEYFFSFCNVEGDKEFRLTAFQNDENYSALYSTLKNEAALQWIASDFVRLNLFNEAMGDFEIIRGYYSTYLNNVNIGNNYNSFLEYCIPYNNYNGPIRTSIEKFLSFVAKTCYLTGTDTKAMTWNKEDLFSVDYASNGKLFSSDKGLFYEYSNITNNSSTTTDSPYYYLVQIAKPTGENSQELIKKVTLPSGRVVKSQNSQDKIFMQYSLMQNGSELGYHHIYSVDLETGSVKNHFDNVPNRNGLEVISFSMAGDKLYYSAVRGTTVENGIVNINTNEYNPLETQRKMVAVYALE